MFTDVCFFAGVPPLFFLAVFMVQGIYKGDCGGSKVMWIDRGGVLIFGASG